MVFGCLLSGKIAKNYVCRSNSLSCHICLKSQHTTHSLFAECSILKSPKWIEGTAPRYRIANYTVTTHIYPQLYSAIDKFEILFTIQWRRWIGTCVCVCVWHPKVKFNYGKIHYRIVESFRILILTFHFNPPLNKREDAGSSSLINATNQPTTTYAFLVWSALQSFQIEIPERPWNGFYIKVATGNTLKILQLQSHLHT